MGNSTEFVGINCFVALTCPVLLNLCPTLLLTTSSDWFCTSINGNTNDTNFITPCLLICFEHVLVVLHGCLARTAPCSPEVNKNNLTMMMFNIAFTRLSLAILEEFGKTSDCCHFFTFLWHFPIKF